MSDISERFELLIFEDAEAYLKRRAVEKAIEEKEAEELRIEKEKKQKYYVKKQKHIEEK